MPYEHMNNRIKSHCLAIISLVMLSVTPAKAGEVKVLAADFQQKMDKSWGIKVTLKHDDSGWDHYADQWQVVDQQGNVLAYRILHHPHVHEQPFTRALVGVKIPENLNTVYIKAHDKVHGWTQKSLKIDLNQVRK